MRYTLKIKIACSMTQADLLLNSLSVSNYRYQDSLLHLTCYLQYGHIPSILQSLSNCDEYTILSVSIVKGDK